MIDYLNVNPLMMLRALKVELYGAVPVMLIVTSNRFMGVVMFCLGMLVFLFSCSILVTLNGVWLCSILVMVNLFFFSIVVFW